MSRALKSLGLFLAFVVIFTLSRHALHSSSATTTSTPSATTSSTSVTSPVCSASDFHGVYNAGQGSIGTVYASVTLTKYVGPACTLEGWPLLTLQDRTGAVLPSSTSNLPTSNSPIQFPDAPANHAPRTLHLSSGQSVNFDLAYSSVPTGTQTCPSVQTLSVQLAKGGPVVAITPQYPPQPCNQGAIWVSPFF